MTNWWYQVTININLQEKSSITLIRIMERLRILEATIYIDDFPLDGTEFIIKNDVTSITQTKSGDVYIICKSLLLTICIMKR